MSGLFERDGDINLMTSKRDFLLQPNSKRTNEDNNCQFKSMIHFKGEPGNSRRATDKI